MKMFKKILLKKVLLITTSVVLSALVFTACGDNKQTSPSQQNNTSTQKESSTSQATTGVLSSFTSTDINNNPVDQEIFNSKKLTMVNIWATYCGPCIREMPELGEINHEYSEKEFQIVGIPVDVLDKNGNISNDSINTAKEIISETSADYIHILPSQSLIKAKLSNVSSVPETIFVDKDGKQVGKKYIGSKTKDQWTKIIDELLGQV